MIIQCDHCRAKFKMDDAKLANGPVKVRCARCKEVFVVKPDAPESDSKPVPLPSVLSTIPSLQPNVSHDGVENQLSPSADVLPVKDQTIDSTHSFSFDVGDFTGQTASDPVENKDTDADSFDWQDTSAPLSSLTVDKDLDEPSFDASPAAPPVNPVSVGIGVETDNFDFGEVDFSAALSQSEPTANGSGVDKDFSADFGEVLFSAESATASSLNDSVVGQVGGSHAKPFINSEEFIFAAPSLKGSTVTVPEPAPESSMEKVNFGEFSFGEMNEKTEISKDSINSVETSVSPTMESSPFGASFETDGEMPPTSLLTRKKGGSFFSSAMKCGSLVLIIALVFSGIYLFGGAKAFSRVGLGFLVEWYGGKAGDEGQIVLRGVTASYVQNSVAGELFVVRGEAVNNYKKSRASVQVKVSVLGQGGAVLITKSAYCGNSLSNEQLSSMPVAKIDETLNNQFGDSLVNLGLKPGGSIPFVVVINPVPKDPKDYTVQVSGSTVATQ